MSPRRSWSVVDASVWVSRYVASDVHYAASHAWLTSFLRAGNVVVAPALLLPEVAGVVARRTGDLQRTQQLILRLRRLPGIRWVSVSPRLRDHAADLAATLRLRGADSVYVALAHRLSIPLITWDNEQLTRAGSLIGVRTP